MNFLRHIVFGTLAVIVTLLIFTVVRWAKMTAYFLLGIVVGVDLVVPMCAWNMLCEPFHAVKTIIGIGLLMGARHGA